MGVHGLWDLLAPVGRRVSVETLTGKKLAIDASIWMVQFMKAMRDEKGEMVRNAHLLGFFRRICKLLFLRTKPVFVFDGATPALKRRTVIARRRQRENAKAKIRKTAEKLLLNHLKAMRLKELANNLENQRQMNDAKGKKVVTDEVELASNNVQGNDNVPYSCDQEALDEMLAASLAAEEDGSFTGNASTSGVEIPLEEEDDDEDEEMVLPAMNGKVDPAVLAALPPSMQLDLLAQMRERLMAENRQKYQKVKKAPAKFSELQIQAYLKTVAFRREIDEVQKSAAGKGVGGVQTSRIASEANREFLFSSSFTGDKQILTSAGVERHGDLQDQTPSRPPLSESMDGISSTKMSNIETASVADDSGRVFDDDIETYLDERGNVRVSRVRAMGIRMTRDLQRNLDLMKEIEHDIVHAREIANSESVLDRNAGGIATNLPGKIQLENTSLQGSDGSVDLDNRNGHSTSKDSNLMEISFEDDGGHKSLDGDDHLFARLVAGDAEMISSGDISPSKRHSCNSVLDCDWEEGVVEEKGDSLLRDGKQESRLSLAEGGRNDESEVDWEDGDSSAFRCAFTSPADPRKTTSKGILEEDADFQEAIRRSIEDLRDHKHSNASIEDGKFEVSEMAHEIPSIASISQENDKPNLPIENVLQIDKSSNEVVSVVERLDGEARMDMLSADDSLGGQLPTLMAVNIDSMEVQLGKPCERYPKDSAELLQQDISEGGNLVGDIGLKKSITPVGEKGVSLVAEKLKSSSGSQMSTCTANFDVSSQISDTSLDGTPHVIVADSQLNSFEADALNHVIGTTQQGESSVNESTIYHDVVQTLSKGNNHANSAEWKGGEMEESTFKDDKGQPIKVTEASLEEEMINLSKERIVLADEQRKLERNAESVSSEMFAECQELLQMFGLPYIIAPMEAEAQCAYMELSNLVDGVVTDDSDVFLFGAQNVYKNIFDDRKYVETYFMKDIENELGLTREQLIRMALLLGSDYTEGVSGIGIVNAIEVVNAFPEEDGLCKFREWIESPDPTILGKFDVQTGSSYRNRGSNINENDVSCSNSNREGLSASEQTVSQSMDYIQNTKQIFMDKHRNVSKNWHIPSSFPNEAVISAYVSPQVDKSTEPFSWGKPDLFVLRKLCWEKLGWNVQKADELILPVLKEYNKHETQLRLEAFYTFNERFAKIRSKRIKKAVKGITGNTSFMQEASNSRKKRRVSPSERRDDNSVKPVSGTEDCVARDESNSTQKSTAKWSKKRKHKEPEPSEAGNFEPLMQAEGRQNISQRFSARGRGRGSEKRQAVGRGRRKKTSGLADAESSSDDGSNSDYEQGMHDEKLEGPRGLRKSTRTRKAVKYTLDEDLEIDELVEKTSPDEENCSDEEAAVQEPPHEDHDVVGDTPSCLQDEVGDSSCGDELEIGGRFCTDEAEPELETGQPGVDQTSDLFPEPELSKEYLNLGGGFCLDEDETNKDTGKCAFNLSRCTNLEADPDLGPVQLDSRTEALDTMLTISPPESVREDDSGMAAPGKSLRAMPYLRRKRRKS